MQEVFEMDKKVNKSGGTLKISNEVLIKIAELAATEIKGVSVKDNKLAMVETPIALANKFLSPIRVKIVGEAAEIDVSIIVLQGYKAFAVAEAVQGSVKSAVQNMTGIAVSKVNVKISGIELTKEEQA